MKRVVYRALAWMAASIASPWVWFHQRQIQHRGRCLTHGEKELAARLGIQRIDDVRVLEIEQVPNPLSWSFGLMEKRGVCVSQVDGITLGHGIYVASSVATSRELMAHELVHVEQYERAGSIWSFLVEYIHQCLMTGYQEARWEVEARSESAKALADTYG